MYTTNFILGVKLGMELKELFNDNMKSMEEINYPLLVLDNYGSFIVYYKEGIRLEFKNYKYLNEFLQKNKVDILVVKDIEVFEG